MADLPKKKTNQPFLRDYQMDAVKQMFTGCILNGGTGSGKSRTALYYFFTKYGGEYDISGYKPMKNQPKLYIITTAMKRDSLEWEGELANLLLDTKSGDIVVDSWNNIKKYADVKNSFFIFDEDRVTGDGVWAKTFIKISKKNEWIILSATPGDCWSDYIPVFIANGFYKNKSEFVEEHIVYARFSKFPQIDRYINTGRLIRLRNKILIDMDFSRHTVPHHNDVVVTYDIHKYKEAIRNRWDPYKDEPIQQAAGLCYVLRRIVNEDETRVTALLEILEEVDKAIIFYNFDYELELLCHVLSQYNSEGYSDEYEIAEWNGHKHQPIPKSDRWIYLVQYNAGCEGWNCITTDTIIFYSQTYSWKSLEQACGRIDRMNTPFRDLYYYHIKSRSGIDLAISKALQTKKTFNEKKFTHWDSRK